MCTCEKSRLWCENLKNSNDVTGQNSKKGDIQTLHNNILSYGFLMALGWFPFGLLASDEQILQRERNIL